MDVPPSSGKSKSARPPPAESSGREESSGSESLLPSDAKRLTPRSSLAGEGGGELRAHSAESRAEDDAAVLPFDRAGPSIANAKGR